MPHARDMYYPEPNNLERALTGPFDSYTPPPSVMTPIDVPKITSKFIRCPFNNYNRCYGSECMAHFINENGAELCARLHHFNININIDDIIKEEDM